MQIFLALFGECWTAWVESSERLAAALSRILSNRGVDVPISALTSRYDVNKTFHELGIKPESTLSFSVRICGQQLYIRHPDGSDQRYTWSHELSDIQNQCFQHTGIPVERQLLVTVSKPHTVVTQEWFTQEIHTPSKQVYLFFQLFDWKV